MALFSYTRRHCPWNISTMSIRSGASSVDGTPFKWKNYFLDVHEVCEECIKDTSRKARPQAPYFHCLVCHKDYQPNKKQNKELSLNNMPIKQSAKIGPYLKEHYTRKFKKESSPSKAGPKHDLTNPPRIFRPTCFEDLTCEEKTLVREGIVIITLLEIQTNNCYHCLSNILVPCSSPRRIVEQSTVPNPAYVQTF